MKIKLIVVDEDGTLTDGKLHVSDCGELYKTFDVRDAHTLKNVLPEAGIVPVINTGRFSKIVEFRAKKFGIIKILQDISDKAGALGSLVKKYSLSLDETAFIGDDLNNPSAMKLNGISGCPADAVDKVKEVADYVCRKSGGYSAFRELIINITGQPKERAPKC